MRCYVGMNVSDDFGSVVARRGKGIRKLGEKWEMIMRCCLDDTVEYDPVHVVVMYGKGECSRWRVLASRAQSRVHPEESRGSDVSDGDLLT
jgi:hypothetical protein